MEVRKGDRVHIRFGGFDMDGTVARILTHHLIVACEGLGHEDGCEHRIDKAHVTDRRPGPASLFKYSTRPP